VGMIVRTLRLVVFGRVLVAHPLAVTSAGILARRLGSDGGT
jgi:hypothetical protein